MSVSRVRENLTHGSRRRREETAPVGPGRAASGASRRPYPTRLLTSADTALLAEKGSALGVDGLPSERRLDRGDVDLRHRHHRVECAFRRCGVRAVEGVEQDARRDLPGEAPAVLAPSTGAFSAAFVYYRQRRRTKRLWLVQGPLRLLLADHAARPARRPRQLGRRS